MSKSCSRDLLKTMVEMPEFDRATANVFWAKDEDGNDFRDNKRMANREMALRFCAFRSTSTAEYSRASSLDAFLLDFTRRIDKSADLDLEDVKAVFRRSMDNCHRILGRAAFRRWPLKGGRRGPLNRAIFESQALALADYSYEDLEKYAEQITERFRALFADASYDASVRSGTGDARRVERRIQMTKDVVQELIA